jgi:NAD+ synthase|tara:strand:- start:296 stop:1030 length:735 start_codon:yes stop_codon:yes gene_type:complete
MNASKRVDFIKNWIIDYVQSMPKKASTLVVGVSGGIDSAVVSTISSMTGLKTFVLSMPIKQIKNQDDLSKLHCNWLVSNFKNVSYLNVDLDNVFSSFENALGKNNSEHAFANSRARLRMATLYQVAGSHNGIVVGTGNKVEDFGVGFYTKYGDGGVDISPIADCTKSQVWEMGEFLKIDQKIISAPPTDGLWVDGRNDEDQLGMTYKELEEAMENPKSKNYDKYLKIRENNLHKMKEIPVCKFD